MTRRTRAWLGLQGFGLRADGPKLASTGPKADSLGRSQREGEKIPIPLFLGPLLACTLTRIPPALWATGGPTISFFPLPKKPLFPSGRGALPLPSQGCFGGFREVSGGPFSLKMAPRGPPMPQDGLQEASWEGHFFRFFGSVAPDPPKSPKITKIDLPNRPKMMQN